MNEDLTFPSKAGVLIEMGFLISLIKDDTTMHPLLHDMPIVWINVILPVLGR